MVGLDRHDVVVPGDRPVGPELALGGVVDRVLVAQPLEERPHGVGPEPFAEADVDLVERRRIGFVSRGLQRADIAVGHGRLP